jgi:hypothetical protein
MENVYSPPTTITSPDVLARAIATIGEMVSHHLAKTNAIQINAIYAIGGILDDGLTATQTAARKSKRPLTRASYIRTIQAELRERGHDVGRLVLDACLKAASLPRSEVDDISKKGVLSLSHFFVLVQIDDPTLRGQLVARVENERLTVNQLANVLQQLYGPSMRPARSVERPEDMPLALDKLQRDIARWTRALNNSCFVRSDWAHAVGMWSYDADSNDVCYEMTAAADDLTQMAKKATDLATELYDAAAEHREWAPDAP